ncbi:MAG TPA: hypothetical protein PKD37_01330 [Oligoflexia bacterium]|nr:hypothetical protein [Oligoflexia bacterium]HMP26618.1 hypothetical protein [Oligoflexia bacterium]
MLKSYVFNCPFLHNQLLGRIITAILLITTAQHLAIAEAQNCISATSGAGFVEIKTQAGVRLKLHEGEGVFKIRYESELPSDHSWKPFSLERGEMIKVNLRLQKLNITNNSSLENIASLFVRRTAASNMLWIMQVKDPSKESSKIIHNLTGQGIICRPAENNLVLDNFTSYISAGIRNEIFLVPDDGLIFAKLGFDHT